MPLKINTKLYGVIAASAEDGRPVLKEAPADLQEEIWEACSFPNPKYLMLEKYSRWGARNESSTITYAETTASGFAFPKGLSFFGLSEAHQKMLKAVSWEDSTKAHPCLFPACRTALTPQQTHALRSFASHVKRKTRPFGNYLFLMPTSSGKTVVQTLAAAHLGQRTLIVVGTNLIKKAWYDDLKQHFGVKQTKVGLIQQSSCSMGEVFTIAVTATLMRRRDWWKEIGDHFGTIIIDEADSIGGKLEDFCREVKIKYLIGASATDGKSYTEMNMPLYLCFGAPIHRLRQSTIATKTMLPLSKVEVFKTPYVPALEVEQRLDWTKLILDISMDEARNALIVDTVTTDWEEGYSCLVVCALKAHVQLIASLLEEKISAVNPLTSESSSKGTAALLSASLDKKTRCIVATQNAVMRGANINAMDRLYFCSPIKSHRILEQLIGRIRRTHQTKSDCQARYFWDYKFGYLGGLYYRSAIPVFKRLKVPSITVRNYACH